ncbi:MAG: ATP-binding protein [Actinobacteria bacterium]|nr:ATP-binding protein [Actinomycetota bacterium]
MIRFPLRYARSNVLIGPGGEAAGLYRIEPRSYPFLSVAEKWGLLHRIERLVAAIGADLSIYRVARPYPAADYTGELAWMADPDHADRGRWHRYLDAQQERLASLDSHVPEVYLAISLVEGRGVGGPLRSFGRARRRLEEVAGVGEASPISAAELRSLAEAERRAFGRAASVVELRRVGTEELQWLLRRAACRGLGEPELERHWRPDALILGGEGEEPLYEPLESDLWEPANAPMREETGGPPSLVVESERGDSHQAFLCLGSLAEEAEFPGGAEILFAPLEGAGPVDAVLHADLIGNRDALAQVRRRVLDVEHSYREQLAGSPTGPGALAEEDRELAREYEAILSSVARPPMLRASISLAAAAADAETLEARVTTLRERYGEVALHRPRGLQHALFLDHLPRPDGGAVADYRRQMTTEQVAASVPVATAAVGSPGGVYLGYDPVAGRPVRFDPTEAPRDSRPSAVLFSGTPGSGKTIAAQAIAHAGLLRGSLVIDFDPKPDHRLAELHGLGDDEVEVLELSADPVHRGKLDPLRIGLPELREELASSYLLELLRDPHSSWEVAIDRAVRDAVRDDEHSLLGVVDRLRESEAPGARDTAEALEVVADFGLARLGFSDPDEADAKLPGGGEHEPSLITIRMPGLNLPEPGTERAAYTRNERVSVATLALVAAFTLKLISRERRRHKIVLLDEGWVFFASSQGRALLNRLIRLGRAFNATVLLATQQVEDLGELAQLVGTVFLFGQDSPRAAARGLEEFGLDPEEGGLASRLTEYRRGRGLQRDLDGRWGEVQVDPDPDLLAELDTTPGRTSPRRHVGGDPASRARGDHAEGGRRPAGRRRGHGRAGSSVSGAPHSGHGHQGRASGVDA